MGEHKINDMWFMRMYELKNKWSAAYTRGRTFLGMQSNQWSESLNSRLHSHLNRQMSLIDLVEHYEFCLLHTCRKEIEFCLLLHERENFSRYAEQSTERESELKVA
jgi:hypothetical protein